MKPASCSRARNGVRPGGNDRVEHDLGAARHDVVDELVVVHVVQREVLLADDRAALAPSRPPTPSCSCVCGQM